MRQFLYEFYKGGIVRISGKYQPSLETTPKSGTWVLYEWKEGKFQMPCFPEVTWPVIRDKMKFIEELKIKKVRDEK